MRVAPGAAARSAVAAPVRAGLLGVLDRSEVSLASFGDLVGAAPEGLVLDGAVAMGVSVGEAAVAAAAGAVAARVPSTGVVDEVTLVIVADVTATVVPVEGVDRAPVEACT